jgi:hypothetical protein
MRHHQVVRSGDGGHQKEGGRWRTSKKEGDADDEADDLIDRVVAAHGNQITRAQALEWLRGDPVGREVARQHSTSKQEEQLSNV